MISLDHIWHIDKMLIDSLPDLCKHTRAKTSLCVSLEDETCVFIELERMLGIQPYELPRTKQESRQGVIDMVNLSVLIICEEFLDKG